MQYSTLFRITKNLIKEGSPPRILVFCALFTINSCWLKKSKNNQPSPDQLPIDEVLIGAKDFLEVDLNNRIGYLRKKIPSDVSSSCKPNGVGSFTPAKSQRQINANPSVFEGWLTGKEEPNTDIVLFSPFRKTIDWKWTHTFGKNTGPQTLNLRAPPLLKSLSLKNSARFGNNILSDKTQNLMVRESLKDLSFVASLNEKPNELIKTHADVYFRSMTSSGEIIQHLGCSQELLTENLEINPFSQIEFASNNEKLINLVFFLINHYPETSQSPINLITYQYRSFEILLSDK